jgi:hypothetical protein
MVDKNVTKQQVMLYRKILQVYLQMTPNIDPENSIVLWYKSRQPSSRRPSCAIRPIRRWSTAGARRRPESRPRWTWAVTSWPWFFWGIRWSLHHVTVFNHHWVLSHIVYSIIIYRVWTPTSGFLGKNHYWVFTSKHGDIGRAAHLAGSFNGLNYTWCRFLSSKCLKKYMETNGEMR